MQHSQFMYTRQGWLEVMLSTPKTTIFLQSDAVATIFSLLAFVWLLFKGGIYFLGKPADINDGLLRYIRVRRWWLLDAVSSVCSLSALLSVVEMTHTTQIVLVLKNYSQMCACAAILAMATICGWLFYSELPIVWPLFKGDIFEVIRYYCLDLLSCLHCEFNNYFQCTPGWSGPVQLLTHYTR